MSHFWDNNDNNFGLPVPLNPLLRKNEKVILMHGLIFTILKKNSLVTSFEWKTADPP